MFSCFERWLARAWRVGSTSVGLLGLICMGPAAAVALSSPSKGPAPAWVAPMAPDLSAPVPAEHIRHGVYFLLADRQVRIEGADRQQFGRYALKVVNEQGLDEAASIDIDFNPAFQKLQLHAVTVHRQGQSIPRLNTAQIHTLQRERELEARVLDGTLSVSIQIPDVRVGDVVEYAYTLRGSRKEMNGRHFGGLDMRWQDPIHRVRARLLWPADQSLQIKPVNMDTPGQESRQGAMKQLEWSAQDVPGLHLDADVPVWYDPYPFVQWSSFQDWGEVGRWAVPLYTVPPLPAGELEREVDRIRSAYPDAGGRVMAVLQYVQKNIRYLSVSMGAGAYAPNPPDVVLKRRFGDCKDKTLLTLTMLKALGIDARAGLVNTRIREGVSRRIASPGAFDHVLVRVSLQGKTYWIDPTRAPQPGSIDNISQPYFGQALVIDPGTSALEVMPQGDATRVERKIRTTFDATDGIGQPARLEVVTELKGLSAERFRSELARSNVQELGRRYLNFYDGYYPGIVSASPVRVTDHGQDNAVTVVEQYRLDRFWTAGDKGDELKAQIRSPDMLDLLEAPGNRVRTDPLRLEYPLQLEQTTEVRLPEDWDIQPAREDIAHAAFSFSDRLETTPRVLTRVSRYVSLQDHVKAADMADYVAQLTRARSAMWLTLKHSPAGSANGGRGGDAWPPLTLGWPLLVCGLAFAGGCLWLGRKMYRHDPIGGAFDPVPGRPIGGWVAVLGVILVIQFVAALGDPASLLLKLFNEVRAHVASGAAFRSTWGEVLQLGFTGLLLTPFFVQLVLFFLRRSSFPRVTYWLTGLSVLLYLLVLAWPAGGAAQTAEKLKNQGLLLGSLLWCVYLSRSERVKGTFVRRWAPTRVAQPAARDAAAPTPDPSAR